jgi:hypothetical protein
MTSCSKFYRLMGLVEPGTRVWLDCLSINQDDHADIAKQVAVMGEIYTNACFVAVLLPEEDTIPFGLLKDVSNAAKLLLSREKYFARNSEEPEQLPINKMTDRKQRLRISDAGKIVLEDYNPPSLEPPMEGPPTSSVCHAFFGGIEVFATRLSTWVYWSRAWTFQEWALAQDLCIGNEGRDETISSVKSSIILAALMVSKYKLRNHQYANIDVGFSRGGVHPRLEQIRSLFPSEDMFIAEIEVNERELAMQTLFPHFAIDQVLGVRSKDSRPRTDDQKFRVRLELMLNAFGLGRRKARFEADLVCCWASMCNIDYDYAKEDSFATALQKVVTALRLKGVKLYNFVVNTQGSCAELDLCFLEYAAYHKQSNATNKARLPGTPVFSGIMDTAVHFRNAATRSQPLVSMKGVGVPIQAVTGAKNLSTTSLTNLEGVTACFSSIVTGHEGASMSWNHPDENVQEVLQEISQESLKELVFAIWSIPVTDADGDEHTLLLWAVYSSSVPVTSIFVAREGLNGTLVLATKTGGNAHVMAYLALTDRKGGSRLIVVDERGGINITLVTRQRSDKISSHALADREYHRHVLLEEESVLAFGSD